MEALHTRTGCKRLDYLHGLFTKIQRFTQRQATPRFRGVVYFRLNIFSTPAKKFGQKEIKFLNLCTLIPNTYMLTFSQAEAKIKEGCTVFRLAWEPCKIIRKWRDSDADYFAEEFVGREEAIIQECNKPCDCRIGIWLEEKDDKVAEDWMCLNHNGN